MRVALGVPSALAIPFACVLALALEEILGWLSWQLGAFS